MHKMRRDGKRNAFGTRSDEAYRSKTVAVIRFGTLQAGFTVEVFGWNEGERRWTSKLVS